MSNTNQDHNQPQFSVPEPQLTAEQAAAALNTSLYTFRRWVRLYGIPRHKNGPKSVRYLWSEILDALAKNGLNVQLRQAPLQLPGPVVLQKPKDDTEGGAPCIKP